MHYNKLLILFTIISQLYCGPAIAANMPLEIINIKASGTGSPAISEYNRIFRAYPGIEYNIRAAVVGGTYPYTYSLSNAPAGMIINSKTGEISWPNPQSNATNIQLSVTDQDNQTVNATWSITVSTSGFKFVQAGVSNGSGTFASPYNSIANMAADANSTDIIYFRDGTYSIGAGGWVTYPVQWIAYPGESPVINMNDTELATPGYALVYFDGFVFDNMDYTTGLSGGVVVGCSDYNTVRRNEFKNFSNQNTSGLNENVGMLRSVACETYEFYYTVIQDNSLHDFQGGNAIGSLYHQNKILIENNHIYNALGQGAGPSHNGISPKVNMYNFTARGNKIAMANGWLVGYDNSDMKENIEFDHNLFVNSSAGRMGVMMNWNLGQGRTWFHHNTLIGDLVLRYCVSSWDIDIINNIISNPNTSIEDYPMNNYIASSDGIGCYEVVQNNLTSTTASTLVNSADEYKLQPAQSAYIGSRGWQLADGSTPMETTGGSMITFNVLTGPGGVRLTSGGNLLGVQQ